MIEESRAYWMIIATLVVLVSVAGWQFHSLAWGDGKTNPSVAFAPLNPPQDLMLTGTDR
jgi:hypothetical protein